MAVKWIVIGIGTSLLLAGAIALGTAAHDPAPQDSEASAASGNDACIVEYRGGAVHVSGQCDHTIIVAPASAGHDAMSDGERRCDDNEESLCEQGDRVEAHECEQHAQHAQVIVQICNLELLEDANVNDAVDVIDDNDFKDTNLTLRDLLDATVNATLS